MNFKSLNYLFIFIGLIVYYISKKRDTLFGKNIWDKKIISFDSNHSKQIFDQYSFTHISHGIISYFVLRYGFGMSNRREIMIISFLIELLFEIIENTKSIIKKFRTDKLNKNYTGDSIMNIVSDLYFNMVGTLGCFYFTPTVSILYVIVSEILLYAIFGDNLIRNIWLILR
jgi:hypothetical protein